MFKKFEENVENLKQNTEIVIKMNLLNEQEMGPFILLVVTPLMMRVQERVRLFTFIYLLDSS